MKRRSFLGSLIAGWMASEAVGQAQEGTPQTSVGLGHVYGPSELAERALSVVHPVCPKCGQYVEFMRRSQFVGDLVPVECGHRVKHVFQNADGQEEAYYLSGCGWKGVSLVAR